MSFALNSVGFNNTNNVGSISKKTHYNNVSFNHNVPSNPLTPSIPYVSPIKFNSTLSNSDIQKYTFLVNYLKDVPPNGNSEGLLATQQLDLLLKNGKLLARSLNNNSTTLDNLCDIATYERAYGVDAKKILCDTLDLLVNPRFVTQQFGDVPDEEVQNILSMQPENSEVLKNPSLMNVEASGVCPAASLEVNAADKYPAEFTEWISKLSSKDKQINWQIDLKAINSNPLDALNILNALKTPYTDFNFKKNKLNISLDMNSYIREQIQAKYWDPGERNTADVLFQGAIMGLGSQATYNALIDWRAPIFNENTQGLVEVEKTLVESIFKNKEITSLVYQQIDENQNLVGYTCPFSKIQKHLTDTLDSGDDVIIGYVLTNETSGRTSSSSYNQSVDGKPNKVINGHEITIVGYNKDIKGNVNFICVDTDDNSQDYVIYSADWLIPKIHHAGYPAHIVKNDEEEIMKKLVA
ncbi:hypothetical protein IJ670_05515 [bacterium]|nr:hypothetical protein [bacterium]